MNSLNWAGGEKQLSKRWLVDAKCRRSGWVMVPHDAVEKLEKEIGDAFDEFETIILDQKIVVHSFLLNRVESLEKSLITQLCDLANNWRKTRIEKFEEARVQVITQRVALAIILELVAQLFARLEAKITDYTLIDVDNPNDEIVYGVIEVLDERVTEAVTKIVRGWK